MARANYLIPGFQYRVTSGLLAEEIVTIIDNHPFPDSDPPELRRKITVKFSDGTEDYMLPRMLSDEPMGIDSPAIQGAAVQQQPVQSVEDDLSVIEPVQATVVASTASQAVIINPVTGQQMTVARVAVTPITGPMDPRLDHLRPSRSIMKDGRYIHRIMMNGMSDTEFLLRYTNDFYRAKNEGRPANIMLKGDTQGGKTLLVQVLAILYADAMGYPKPMPVFTLSGSSGVTDFDLFGQAVTYADPDSGMDRLVNLPGVVTLAAQCGGILYLDEINAMGERVTSSLHSIADHRHQFTNRGKAVVQGGVFMPEIVTAHEDLWIVGTYNDGNYRGMGKLNEAFLNRFRHIRWGYDEDVEAKLIASPSIRLAGEALRNARRANTKGFKTPVGTAALMRLEEDVQELGVDLAIEVFKGMFEQTELDVVSEIIDVRIRDMLQEEANQRELNALAEANDDRSALANMLGGE